jgi:polyhydroxyalkanoate synthesis regulator phasin
MKSEFLKIANVKTQKEFYDKYPNEASFFAAHPEAKHLKTMARGGSASGNKQQQQIMQIIQAYAKVSGSDPRQIMQQLQQMQPQQQQQALQQMMQSLQGQGQQMMAQQQGQPQMQMGGGLNHYDTEYAYGGYTTHPYQVDNHHYQKGGQNSDATYVKRSDNPVFVKNQDQPFNSNPESNFQIGYNVLKSLPKLGWEKLNVDMPVYTFSKLARLGEKLGAEPNKDLFPQSPYYNLTGAQRELKELNDLQKQRWSKIIKGEYSEGGYYMGNDGQRHKSTGANWSGNAFYADGGSAPLEYPHMFKYPPYYEIGPHMAYGGYYQDGGQQPQQSQGVDPQQIMQEIAQKLQQGEDPNQIVQELVQEGVPQDQAQQMVQAVVQQMQQQQGGGQDQGQSGMKYGGIHINPANKGKFTATKKATGKSTEELTHSKNPITKKRAIFAQNAAKWKHETGGQYGGQYMQDGGISIGQTMDVTPEQAQYLKQMGYTFEKL